MGIPKISRRDQYKLVSMIISKILSLNKHWNNPLHVLYQLSSLLTCIQSLHVFSLFIFKETFIKLYLITLNQRLIAKEVTAWLFEVYFAWTYWNIFFWLYCRLIFSRHALRSCLLAHFITWFCRCDHSIVSLDPFGNKVFKISVKITVIEGQIQFLMKELNFI